VTARRWLFLVVLLLMAFALRLHRFAELGTQADEGVHIAAAERLAAGDVLYRDLFENRTPGVEWFLSLVFRLAGGSILLPRLLSIGAALVTIASLIVAGRQLAGRMGGFSAAVFFTLAPLPIFWSRFTMLEHFQSAASCLSVACALLAWKRQSRWWWFASGILGGMGFLAKQTGLVAVGAVGLFVLLQCFSGKQLIAGFFAFATGVAVVVTGFVIILLLQQALGDFLRLVSAFDYWHLMNNWPEKWRGLLAFAVERPVFGIALLGFVTLLIKRARDWQLLLIWFAAEWTVLFLPAQLSLDWGGFSHYAIPAVAVTCLLAGVTVGQTLKFLHSKPMRQRRVLLGAAFLCLLVYSREQLADLRYVIKETDYPVRGFSQEAKAGQALAEVTPSETPALVFANSIFYHWSQRRPSNRYFHYPAALSTSSISSEVDRELTNALSQGDTGAVLVSRMHLDDRLSPAVRGALWSGWMPVAIFEYPYQRDLFLFVPKSENLGSDEPLVTFETGLELLDFEFVNLSIENKLVGLKWSSQTTPEFEYVAFVHLVTLEGELVAQHDGVPVVGFRPTTSWQANESIEDWHWIEAVELTPGDYQLVVGLYAAVSGERLRLSSNSIGSSDNAFIQTIRIDS